MIRPTVGRIVWYHPTARDPGPTPLAQPLAAIIAHVHSDELVNLGVFDANGSTYSRTSVTLVQDEETVPEVGQCQWMPYQRAAAAKDASLEDDMKDRIAALESAVHAHANSIMTMLALHGPKDEGEEYAEEHPKATAAAV